MEDLKDALLLLHETMPTGAMKLTSDRELTCRTSYECSDCAYYNGCTTLNTENTPIILDLYRKLEDSPSIFEEALNDYMQAYPEKFI